MRDNMGGAKQFLDEPLVSELENHAAPTSHVWQSLADVRYAPISDRIADMLGVRVRAICGRGTVKQLLGAPKQDAAGSRLTVVGCGPCILVRVG
jgi:hypothetical protein